MTQDYLKWKPIFVRILEEEYNKSKQKMHCHDASHHLRVWEHALTVVDKYQADKEILLAACLLHDISAQRKDLDHSNSQENDAKIAEEVLKKVNFPEQKIPLVIQAIKHHGSSSDKNQRNFIEAQILCDADKLECLGPIGITRIFTALITRGKSIKEITRLYHNQGKLDQKYNAISLPEFKEKAKKDYEYAKDFFKKLAETLEKK